MSNPIETITKMMETLPEPIQNQVAEKLREYIEEMQDETQWDSLFKRNDKLIKAAKRARQEIAEPMDFDKL